MEDKYIYQMLNSIFQSLAGAYTEIYGDAKYYWPLQDATSYGVYDTRQLARGDVHEASFIENARIGGAASFIGLKKQWIAVPSGI